MLDRAKQEVKGQALRLADGTKYATSTAAIGGAFIGGLKLTEMALESNVGRDLRDVARENGVNYVTQALEPMASYPEHAATGFIGVLGATAFAIAARKISGRVIEGRNDSYRRAA